MSLVEEVLAKHLSCESYGTPAHEKPCCLRCFGDVEWPCPTVRLATELQNAQAVVKAMREEHRRGCKSYPPCQPAVTWLNGDWIDPPYECPVASALARYDEGRKA